MKRSRKQVYADRRARGQCMRCPGQAEEGKTICAACLAKQQAERRSERLKYNAPEKKKTRDCLRCDRSFTSEGPHNRLCQSCQEFLGVNPTGENVRRLPRVLWLAG